jgi:DUF1365 family protein
MMSILLLSLAVLSVPLLLLFVVLPLAVAFLATLRGSYNYRQQFQHSKLYVGQVWHTRFQPKRHAFSYPIFMFVLDLEELPLGNYILWPIVAFRDDHHLKNGEGVLDDQKKDQESSSSSTSSKKKKTQSLAERVLRLVATKTKDKCQPTLDTHRVLILTHLEYFGYNFNPVSFYYIVSKATNELTAMVGEVSNTPWMEMFCYVLHPDSVDQVQVTSTSTTTTTSQTDYRFPKQFHVSPFMEMDYWYDWSFVGVPGCCENENENRLTVINSMRRLSDNELAFTAKLKVEARPITPFGVAWQMIRFPIFCMMIQIWIHYQAVWLFVKGIAYVPHPEGSETAVSQAIAALMTPFFAMRDRISPKNKTE